MSALHVHNACTGASRGNDAITADRVGFYDDSSAHKFCTLLVTLIQRCRLGPGQLFNCNVARNKRPAVNTVVEEKIHPEAKADRSRGGEGGRNGVCGVGEGGEWMKV